MVASIAFSSVMFEPISTLHYFRILTSDPNSIPLLEAAASIAVDAYPNLDVQATLSEVDGLSSQLAQRCQGKLTEHERLQRTLRFFYGEMGFAGNAEHYYDRDNSYLHRVLQTRRGIPITLAVLLIELARGVGLQLEGVSFPGHFLVKATLQDGLVVIDPFTGESLDRTELNTRAAAFGMRPERLLQPASGQQILVRMLSNLHAIHTQGGEEALLGQVRARLQILQGEQIH